MPATKGIAKHNGKTFSQKKKHPTAERMGANRNFIELALKHGGQTPLSPLRPRLEPLTPDQHHQANTEGGGRPQNGAKIVLFVEIEEDEVAVVGTIPASPIWTGLLLKSAIE